MDFRFAIALGGVLYTGAANAADYPVKTVRMVVPFAAGGSTDLLARSIAQRLKFYFWVVGIQVQWQFESLKDA